MAAFFKLSRKCAFYPYEGSCGAQEFILRTPTGRQLLVSPLAKEILESLDGDTSLEVLAKGLQSRGMDIHAEDLQNLLEEQYGALEVFEGYGQPSVRGKATGIIAFPVFLHRRLLSAPKVVAIAKPLNFLFNRFIVVAGLFAIAASHYWVYRRQLPAIFEDETEINLIIVALLALGSVFIHELGHASAVIRYGGSPGWIGFGLYALMPAFYTDVSESWRFPRRQRMVVDCGGVYFQQLVFCVFAVLHQMTGVAEFAVACTLVDTMTVFTLNPLFQFDGYWLMVDYLGLHDLRRLAWNQIKRWLLRSKDIPPLPAMRRSSYLIFLAYAIGSVGFIALLLRMEYRYLLVPSAGFFLALPNIIHAVGDALKAHAIGKLGNLFLGLLYAIMIPLSTAVGLSIYLRNIYRYSAQRLRRQSKT